MATLTGSLQANGLTFVADSAGEGDTVALLLHGFPECRQSWARQLPALATLGWRAVAPDMRGYGDSSRPKGNAAYRIERLVEDVDALFDALGARRRILVGHDWGGAIAWQAALRSVPLDGLVILNAPHPARFAQVLKTWDQRKRSWYIAFFLLPWLPEWLLTQDHGRPLMHDLRRQSANFPAELLETMRRNLTAPGAATAMLHYYRANIPRLARGVPSGTPIECPTLLLWGERDIYLSPTLASGNERFVANLSAHRFPDASHWVQQDASYALHDAIADWADRNGLCC
ncbi:MAG TPA: alpha/beta hydrolase [Croceibacterium sp.]|jgi:pimeloyl-ACP methyl ester carboxylesterase